MKLRSKKLDLAELVTESERLGKIACSDISSDHRSSLGQFFTPATVATFLAKLFGEVEGQKVRLLDPGAGVGTLTTAFVAEILSRDKKPRSIDISAWEIERRFLPSLEAGLSLCVQAAESLGVEATFSIQSGSFLEGGADLLGKDPLFSTDTETQRFTHAILNPPYGKINTDSRARQLVRRAGLETSNLYTGFMWIAAQLLAHRGEMVTITPRSFCNGPYFTPFRKQFFEQMSVKTVHVFDRRDALFSTDDVLQENLVMHARRDEKKPTVITLSSSDGVEGDGIRSREVPYSQVLSPSDPQRVVHLTLDETDDTVKQRMAKMESTLKELGIAVSTGRVVDFRAKEFLRKDPEGGTVPLIYPTHFNGGCVHWPRLGGKKPNALVATDRTEDLLVPNGIYVLVKRFTAKEEKRRVVATVFMPKAALAEFASVGFENHLNYFYGIKDGLDEALARGLAIYLNSGLVDTYFRQFSGHTQVNATDLRNLRYPTRTQLRALGRKLQGEAPLQPLIDQTIEAMA